MTITTNVEVLKVDVELPRQPGCDACGAQPYVEIETVREEEGKAKTTALLLCAHDYNEHEEALLAGGTVKRIIDHRPRLYKEEGESQKGGF